LFPYDYFTRPVPYQTIFQQLFCKLNSLAGVAVWFGGESTDLYGITGLINADERMSIEEKLHIVSGILRF
jgi:hypothetical protein